MHSRVVVSGKRRSALCASFALCSSGATRRMAALARPPAAAPLVPIARAAAAERATQTLRDCHTLATAAAAGAVVAQATTELISSYNLRLLRRRRPKEEACHLSVAQRRRCDTRAQGSLFPLRVGAENCSFWANIGKSWRRTGAPHKRRRRQCSSRPSVYGFSLLSAGGWLDAAAAERRPAAPKRLFCELLLQPQSGVGALVCSAVRCRRRRGACSCAPLRKSNAHFRIGTNTLKISSSLLLFSYST